MKIIRLILTAGLLVAILGISAISAVADGGQVPYPPDGPAVAADG